METQTQSTAAELSVPLPILMPSVVMKAVTAPFYQKEKNNEGEKNNKKTKQKRALLFIKFNQSRLFLSCKRDATGALHCAFSQSQSLYLTLPKPNLCPEAHLSAAALPEQRMETRV